MLNILQEPVALTKTLIKLRIWMSLIYHWKSQLVTQLAREVSYHLCILCFHMGLIRCTFLFSGALSRLAASHTNFVPPVPVQLSEAVARRLISVEIYYIYRFRT